jgi:outer membrane protein assembly factor BamA
LLATAAGRAQTPPPSVELLPPNPIPATGPIVPDVRPAVGNGTPAPATKVGTIFIIGNDFTRQHVILRQLPEGLAPGQVLQYPDLRVAERNLSRVGIFESQGELGVHPTVEVLNREGDQEYKDLLVRVQEARTTSLMFGASVNSDTSLSGSIVFNEKNFDITRFPTSFDDFLAGRAFRGAGQEFRAEAVPGVKAQRYDVAWREPYLFDSRFDNQVKLLVSTYYYSHIYDEYTESRVGSRITLEHKLGPYWSVNGGVRIEGVGVHDVVPWDPPDYTSVAGNHFLLGLSAGVAYDTTDSIYRPSEGNRLVLSYEEVTGQFTFPAVNLDYYKYWTVRERPGGSGRHVLAYHGQMRWEGSEAPVYERFFEGGFLSMRGFQFRGISPLVNGVPVGGDFMLLNRLDYLLPVLANDRILFLAFVDSGTVEPRMEIKDYRVSAGFGLRLVVPQLGPVPVALDFGFPIVKGPGDKEQVFSFALGFFH